MSEKNSANLFARVVDEDVLALEQAMIQIPSSSFEEHALADYLADYMADVGLAVDMMEVAHPLEKGVTTRQPVGRLVGDGGGPSLMLNGHMDPGVEMSGWSVDPYAGVFRDGWIWGMGAHDDKGGLAAALSAVKAIIDDGVRLRGDIVVCPVAGHKVMGAGTRALIKHGVLTDFCINLEHAANTIATVCVGIVMVRIKTKSPELFFRHNEEAKANYFNPVEQQCEIIRRIGASIEPIKPGGWLSFDPHEDLPGFPMLSIDAIHRDHYLYKGANGNDSRTCEMTFQIRTIPGQTEETIRADLERLFQEIRTDHPAFDAEIIIPADGPAARAMDPMEIDRNSPLVTSLAKGHALATGIPPQIGSGLRLGNVGDGNLMYEAGVPTLQYGPGDIRIYDEWPAPDERVELADLVNAARAIAYALRQICG